jgi:hypothetical protein
VCGRVVEGAGARGSVGERLPQHNGVDAQFGGFVQVFAAHIENRPIGVEPTKRADRSAQRKAARKRVSEEARRGAANAERRAQRQVSKSRPRREQARAGESRREVID